MSTSTLVTGGAGFIGTNMADRLLRNGERVVILDNLSRPGVRDNLQWLQDEHRGRLRVEVGDVRDSAAVRSALKGVERVFHFAAQVAVTTSVEDPVNDFSINLGGTLTLLEELRRLDTPPPLLFTSTNKVYGSLGDIVIQQRGPRYEPADARLRAHGVSEERPLHFCSPYGCSKGGADQYVLDYAASYGMPTVVFRMSCIYGPHQCGNEDQGWVAHFLMRALAREPITLYGDGMQTRDILFVDDLIKAMLLATDSIDDLAGRAFNVGGGPDSAVSLLELLAMIEQLEGVAPSVAFGPWRVGDQQYYVSDTRAFTAATGWRHTVGPAAGVARLRDWLRDSRVGMSLSEAV
jgi:CDP-paratose 2-epimerase